MQFLVILNDPAYGTERSYNGFRLARTLAGQEGAEVRVFLMGDAVTCAMAGQKTPNGYYNLERMLHSAVAKGAQVGCCSSCLDARGIADDRITEGAGAPRWRSSPNGRSGLRRDHVLRRIVGAECSHLI